MSSRAPKNKIKGVMDLGAEVILVEGEYADAARKAKEYCKEHKVTYIPAYEHPDIILGQSSVATEIFLQMKERGIFPDEFYVPVGGGGLAAGIGFVADQISGIKKSGLEGILTKAKVIGVQALRCNTMARSFLYSRTEGVVKVLDFEPISGSNDSSETIADGIRVRDASSVMLSLVLPLSDIVSVSEDQIKDEIRMAHHSKSLNDLIQNEGMRRLYGIENFPPERIGRMNVLEGAGAAPIAAARSKYGSERGRIKMQDDPSRDLHVVLIGSGNNIDEEVHRQIIGGIQRN